MGQDRKSKRERKSVEILPIINKPKHPKKNKEGIHKEQSERTHSCPKRQKNHLRAQTTRRTSSSQTPSRVPIPPPVARSISNKERRGLPERKRHEKDTKQKDGAKGVHKYQTDIHIHNMPNCGHKGFYLGKLLC
jgi:hypothetical protein